MPRKKDTITLTKAQSTEKNTDILHLAKKTFQSLLSKIKLNISDFKNELVFFNKARFNVFNNKSLQFIFLPE